MKFDRYPHHATRPNTKRRIYAARRALQRQAEAVALFPELAPTENAWERLERLDAEARAHWQSIRDHTAQTWRKARREFRQLTPAQRDAVLRRWLAPVWHPPHEAHYLADLIWTVTHNRKETV